MQTINSLISYSVENDLIVNCYISIIKVNHKVRPIQANNDIYNFIKISFAKGSNFFGKTMSICTDVEILAK